MREYSVECGAKKPETLRGTQLRKHIATSSVLYNLNDVEVKDLANFMVHSQTIHEEHYRLPIAAREITEISKVLEMVQGEEPDDPDFTFNHSNTSNEYMDDEPNPAFHRRSSSPYGSCKRTSWTNANHQLRNFLAVTLLKVFAQA